MNNGEKESKIVVALAGLGFLFVLIFAISSFFYDKNLDSSNEEKQGIPKQENVQENNFDQYGILFSKKNYKITVNPSIDPASQDVSILDCRKFSTSFRQESISAGAECFGVLVEFGSGYIVITTGDDYFQDPDENSIQISNNGSIKTIAFDTKINLPLERIEIDGFPTNLNGVRVQYSDGTSYTFYKGVVYKWANKYAVMVKGEMDTEKRDFLDKLELE